MGSHATRLLFETVIRRFGIEGAARLRLGELLVVGIAIRPYAAKVYEARARLESSEHWVLLTHCKRYSTVKKYITLANLNGWKVFTGVSHDPKSPFELVLEKAWRSYE